MATNYFVVLTNPVEGREDEYNEWYTNRHLFDLLQIPGIIAAQRFKLSQVQRGPGPHKYKYLAIYEMDGADTQVVADEISKRSGTALLPRSDALAEGTLSFFYEPLTERMIADR